MNNLEDRLKKFTEFLDSPEGKEHISEFAKKMVKEKQEKIDFFNSQRCQEILDLFEKSDLEHISDEDYHYHKEKVSFLFNSQEESTLFFNSLIEGNNKNSIIDEDADFSTTLSYINKKFVAKLVCGQGSYIVLSKLATKLVEIKNVELGIDNEQPYGYIQAIFEDGTNTIQCFGNPNKIVSHFVLKK